MVFQKLDQWVVIECDECGVDEMGATARELFDSGWVLFGRKHLCSEHANQEDAKADY